MYAMGNVNRWYVICFQGGHDERALEFLKERGFDPFSPLGKKIIVHKRYKTKLTKKFRLFPGYAFILANSQEEISEATQCPRVTGFLGQDDLALPLPVGCVENIIASYEAGLFDLTKKRTKGDKVTIELFGERVSAEVRSISVKGTIEVVADYMGRMVTVADCAERLRIT